MSGVPVNGVGGNSPDILKFYAQFRAETGDNSGYIARKDYMAPDGAKHRFTHAGFGRDGVKSGGMGNRVDAPVIRVHDHNEELEHVEGAGNFFFKSDGDTLDERVSAIEGYEDAKAQEIADALFKHDDLKVSLSAYTDTVGSRAYNEGLAQRRSDTVRGEIERLYIKRGLDGVPEDQVTEKTAALKARFDSQIKLNLAETIGVEDETREKTLDEVDKLVNRSVLVEYVLPPTEHGASPEYVAHKGEDTDNHYHTVVVPVDGMGSSRYLIMPEPKSVYDPETKAFSLIEEEAKVIFPITADEKFEVDFAATETSVAGKYKFYVEADNIDDVHFSYNADTNIVEMSVGAAEISIKLRQGVEPSFEVGIAKYNADIAEYQAVQGKIEGYEPAQYDASKIQHSPIYVRALRGFKDDVVSIAKDANNGGDPTALASRIDVAFNRLAFSGVNEKVLDLYKGNLMETYADPQSENYKPGELTYPAEVYISLGEYHTAISGYKELASAEYSEKLALYKNPREVPETVMSAVKELLDEVGLGDLNWQNDLSQGLAIAVDSVRDSQSLTRAFDAVAKSDPAAPENQSDFKPDAIVLGPDGR